MRPHLAMRLGAVVTGLLIVVAALSYFQLFGQQSRHAADSSFAAPDHLSIRTGSADVEVLPGRSGVVQVTQRTRTLSGRTVDAPTLAGGRLSLPDSCNGTAAWLLDCSISYVVRLPSAMPLDLEAGSGDLIVRRLTAPLTLRTGSGDIDASELVGSAAVVEAGSGDVRLSYTSAPMSIDAATGSGDLQIEVPQGALPYRVVAKTGSGDYHNSVETSPDAPNEITGHTGSGDLSVSYSG